MLVLKSTMSSTAIFVVHNKTTDGTFNYVFGVLKHDMSIEKVKSDLTNVETVVGYGIVYLSPRELDIMYRMSGMNVVLSDKKQRDLLTTDQLLILDKMRKAVNTVVL